MATAKSKYTYVVGKVGSEHQHTTEDIDDALITFAHFATEEGHAMIQRWKTNRGKQEFKGEFCYDPWVYNGEGAFVNNPEALKRRHRHILRICNSL